jgi:hypothetical protein
VIDSKNACPLFNFFIISSKGHLPTARNTKRRRLTFDQWEMKLEYAFSYRDSRYYRKLV